MLDTRILLAEIGEENARIARMHVKRLIYDAASTFTRTQVYTEPKAICTTYSPEIPFQSRIQMAHAATDTWHQAPSIIAGQRAPVEPENQWWRKGDAKMGTVFDPCLVTT